MLPAGLQHSGGLSSFNRSFSNNKFLKQSTIPSISRPAHRTRVHQTTRYLSACACITVHCVLHRDIACLQLCCFGCYIPSRHVPPWLPAAVSASKVSDIYQQILPFRILTCGENAHGPCACRATSQPASQRGPAAPNALATMVKFERQLHYGLQGIFYGASNFRVVLQPAVNETVASIAYSDEWRALEEHLGEVDKM